MSSAAVMIGVLRLKMVHRIAAVAIIQMGTGWGRKLKEFYGEWIHSQVANPFLNILMCMSIHLTIALRTVKTP